MDSDRVEHGEEMQVAGSPPESDIQMDSDRVERELFDDDVVVRLARIRSTFADRAVQCSRCTFTIAPWRTHLLIAGDRVCGDCVLDSERTDQP